MVLHKGAFFFLPQLPPLSKFVFITVTAIIFFNMDLQAPHIRFFVHQTIQNTIHLQGRQLFHNWDML